MKKKWHGEGKRNWFGWKVETWETIKEATIRELHEEAGVSLLEDNLKERGIIQFTWKDYPDRDSEVHVFVATYSWDFIESDEMKPQWFDISEVPLDEMWQDDKYWLPQVLDGQTINAIGIFEGEDRLWDFEIN